VRLELTEVLITLRAARQNIQLTRVEAANQLGIHHETLCKYENDCTNIPRSILIQLEKIYGIPTDFIYFGKETDYLKKMKNRLAGVS
jgi:transcriptional regulator with XRE-family HTH domain